MQSYSRLETFPQSTARRRAVDLGQTDNRPYQEVVAISPAGTSSVVPSENVTVVAESSSL